MYIYIYSSVLYIYRTICIGLFIYIHTNINLLASIRLAWCILMIGFRQFITSIVFHIGRRLSEWANSGPWTSSFGYYITSCKFINYWLDDRPAHATTCNRLRHQQPVSYLLTMWKTDVSWLTLCLIGGVATDYGLCIFSSGPKMKDKNLSKISGVYLSSSFSLQHSPEAFVLLGLAALKVFW